MNWTETQGNPRPYATEIIYTCTREGNLDTYSFVDLNTNETRLSYKSSKYCQYFVQAYLVDRMKQKYSFKK